MITQIDNVLLLGSSHVAKESQKEIEQAIIEHNPELVCIELDADRFKSLFSKNTSSKKNKQTYKTIKELGVFGFMFASIASFVQQKVGSKINIDPGIDMKTAYLKARDHNIPVALIDQNIKITLKKFSALGFTKKMKLISQLFFRSFKKEYRELLDFDLNTVPDDKVVKQMIGILKKETPELYRILIDDRNKYMVKKIMQLREHHQGNILVVVGAGHVEGMEEILRKKLKTQAENSISFSFQAEYVEL